MSTSTNPECVVPDCAIPGQHYTDCPCGPDCTLGTDPDHAEDHCTGCLPGLADDGILVCRHHHRRAVRLLRELPTLDDALVRATVRRTSAVGEYVTVRGLPTGIELNETVLATKDSLREDLALFVSFVIVERGLSGFDGTPDVRTMTRFLDRHATWLSANPITARSWPVKIPTAWADARRHAYPTRPDGTVLGECECGTTVRFTPSDYSGTNTATCRGCGNTKTVTEWEQELSTDPTDGDLYTVAQLVRCIAVRHGKAVPASTIRRWASSGKLTQHGKDKRGRGLYNPNDALKLATHLRDRSA